MSVHRNIIIISEGIQIETEIVLPEADTNRVVILCHPHPLYGGNMDNPVIISSSAKLNHSGIATVRFNFRGVGGSSGIYDEGKGEISDTIDVIKYVVSSPTFSDTNRSIGLLGYSFGAKVALSVASQYRGLKSIALISPPDVEKGFDFSAINMPKLLVAGDEDQFDAHKSVESLEFNLPKPSKIKIYPDDHFWLNEVEKMTGDVNDFFIDSL
tara:strand:+ start:306 stop:941 length:636 start_codon:yes stop_codon:yes gene_type:complete